MTIEKSYAGRDQLLARSGKLREDGIVVDGETYLVREISGRARNQVISAQAAARLRGDMVDLDGYQRLLLLHGLVDPASPQAARTPLLEEADLDAVMELGAGFLDAILERIEQLAGLAVDTAAATG